MTEPASPTRFGVVMPVRDAMTYLDEVLEALRAATVTFGSDRVTIALVDNGSNDGSLKRLRLEEGCGVRVLVAPGLCVGAVRNFGARILRCDFLVFLDADCLIGTSYFTDLDQLLSDRELDVTGSRYALPKDPCWIEKAWHLLHERNWVGSVPYINAGNFVIRRDVFVAHEGFSEDLQSGEDAEFCQRLRLAGLVVEEVPEVRAEHLGNPKSLTAFFRKQVWHGRGALGTAKKELDLPLLVTVFHTVGALVSVCILGWGVLTATFWPFVVSGLLVMTPSVCAVMYRLFQGGEVRAAPAGVLLYFLYFSARAWSLIGQLFLERRLLTVG